LNSLDVFFLNPQNEEKGDTIAFNFYEKFYMNLKTLYLDYKNCAIRMVYSLTDTGYSGITKISRNGIDKVTIKGEFSDLKMLITDCTLFIDNVI